jgi:hypothetical protein
VDIVANAAVIGETFPIDLLVALADVSRSDAMASLRHARDAGIVQELPTPGVMQFAHPIMREVALSLLLSAERQERHRRLADVRSRSSLIRAGVTEAMFGFSWAVDEIRSVLSHGKRWAPPEAS